MSMRFGVRSAVPVYDRMVRRARLVPLALLALVLALPGSSSAERCGATERWFVKVGTDPRASEVDLANPIPITVAGLNALPKLQGTVPHNDNKTRLDEELKVYTVSGFLALFKDEDDDYHLVITDESLRYTPGGSGTDDKETGTSFIAQVVHPDDAWRRKHGPRDRRPSDPRR